MAKNWWFKFEYRVWQSDPELSGCSLAARGLWLEILCLLYAQDDYTLTASYEKLGRMARCDSAEVARLVIELKDNKVADVTLGHGEVTVMSRRLKKLLKARKDATERKRKERVTHMSHDRVISNKKEVRNNTHSSLKRDAAEAEMCVPLKAAEKDSSDVAACIAGTVGESDRGIGVAAAESAASDAVTPGESNRGTSADVARFIPRESPRKLQTASPTAGDVPPAFAPWRDAFEDWWCPMLGLVSLPANVDTTNDLTWLFDNGFTLDEIKAFYKWATTDPDEKKWRRGPVKIGTIVKGIADWRKNAREQAEAKPPEKKDFSWCRNGCNPQTGIIFVKKDKDTWVPVQCQHRRAEVEGGMSKARTAL